MEPARRTRNLALAVAVTAFTIAFVVVVIPPLISRQHGDVIGALGEGFANPFAAGYALDIFSTYTVLAIWIAYEAVTLKVRGGWIALVVGAVPGVAAGLALYLLLRERQLRAPERSEGRGA